MWSAFFIMMVLGREFSGYYSLPITKLFASRFNFYLTLCLVDAKLVLWYVKKASGGGEVMMGVGFYGGCVRRLERGQGEEY